MRVLHVEAGRHLYGGPQQVLQLVRGLTACNVDSPLVAPPGSTLAMAAAEAGVAVHPLPMRGEVDPGLWLRLTRLIRRLQPDLVHLHSRRGADLWGALAARRAGIPAVLSRRVDNPEAAWLARRKYRLYAHVIAISEAIRQVLLAEGVPPDQVTCVPSAIELLETPPPCDGERLQGLLGRSPQGPLIGVAAQLIGRKGHGYLLEAMVEVVRAHPSVHLVCFGQGPLEAKLRRQIERLGLARHVTLVGFRADLDRLLPCLDLLVHPATMEGLGVVLLQAAAAGVPAVASRAGGIPELIEHGLNGLLVAPGDVQGLADAIKALIGDPERRRQMGKAGRERVASRFSVDAMVAGNLAVYRKVLAAADEALCER